MEQPPKRYTFEQPKLKKWVEKWCKGKVLNLFAGRTKLLVNEVRVDMDINMPADFHMEAEAFIFYCIQNHKKFNTIVLDPPYSLRKAREKYEGRYIGSFTKIKNLLSKLLKPGGRIITLGYSTVGMSRSRGFKKIAICVICNNGDFDNTAGIVEDVCRQTEEKDLYVTVEVSNA